MKNSKSLIDFSAEISRCVTGGKHCRSLRPRVSRKESSFSIQNWLKLYVEFNLQTTWHELTSGCVGPVYDIACVLLQYKCIHVRTRYMCMLSCRRECLFSVRYPMVAAESELVGARVESVEFGSYLEQARCTPRDRSKNAALFAHWVGRV